MKLKTISKLRDKIQNIEIWIINLSGMLLIYSIVILFLIFLILPIIMYLIIKLN